MAPTALAEMENSSQFFSELARQAETAWEEMSLQLAGPSPADEPYLERVGRLEAARLQAEELVMSEWCRPPAQLVEEPIDGPDRVSTLVHQLAAERATATPT